MKIKNLFYATLLASFCSATVFAAVTKNELLFDELHDLIEKESISFSEAHLRGKIERCVNFFTRKKGFEQALQEAVEKKFFLDFIRDGCTLAHLAAHYGNLNALEILLKKEPKLLNSKSKNGLTPLHYATYKGHIKIIKFLKESNVDFSQKDNQGKTALHIAVEEGHEDVVQELATIGNLNLKGFADTSDFLGRTALHYACQEGYIKIAEILIETFQASIETADLQGNTPLHIASEHGHQDIINFLKDKGADETKVSTTGKKADQLKIEFDTKKTHEKCFSDLRVSIESMSCNELEKEIDDALLQGLPVDFVSEAAPSPSLLQKLRNNEVLPYFQNSLADTLPEGPSLLHVAAACANVKAATKLIEKGASVSLIDKKGRTPLHYACMRCDERGDVIVNTSCGPCSIVAAHSDDEFIAFVERLITPENINLSDKFGSTPLHYAAFYNNSRLIKLLLEKGANPSLKNKEGKTAFDLVKEGEGKVEIQKSLRTYQRKELEKHLSKKIWRNEKHEVIGTFPGVMTPKEKEVIAEFIFPDSEEEIKGKRRILAVCGSAWQGKKFICSSIAQSVGRDKVKVIDCSRLDLTNILSQETFKFDLWINKSKNQIILFDKVDKMKPESYKNFREIFASEKRGKNEVLPLYIFCYKDERKCPDLDFPDSNRIHMCITSCSFEDKVQLLTCLSTTLADHFGINRNHINFPEGFFEEFVRRYSVKNVDMKNLYKKLYNLMLMLYPSIKNTPISAKFNSSQLFDLLEGRESSIGSGSFLRDIKGEQKAKNQIYGYVAFRRASKELSNAPKVICIEGALKTSFAQWILKKLGAKDKVFNCKEGLIESTTEKRYDHSNQAHKRLENFLKESSSAVLIDNIEFLGEKSFDKLLRIFSFPEYDEVDFSNTTFICTCRDERFLPSALKKHMLMVKLNSQEPLENQLYGGIWQLNSSKNLDVAIAQIPLPLKVIAMCALWNADISTADYILQKLNEEEKDSIFKKEFLCGLTSPTCLPSLLLILDKWHLPTDVERVDILETLVNVLTRHPDASCAYLKKEKRLIRKIVDILKNNNKKAASGVIDVEPVCSCKEKLCDKKYYLGKFFGNAPDTISRNSLPTTSTLINDSIVGQKEKQVVEKPQGSPFVIPKEPQTIHNDHPLVDPKVGKVPVLGGTKGDTKEIIETLSPEQPVQPLVIPSSSEKGPFKMGVQIIGAGSVLGGVVKAFWPLVKERKAIYQKAYEKVKSESTLTEGTKNYNFHLYKALAKELAIEAFNQIKKDKQSLGLVGAGGAVLFLAYLHGVLTD